MLEFIADRGLIDIINDGEKSQVQSKKKTEKDSYYKPKLSYVRCLIDVSLLPVQLDLPMICPPVDWRCIGGNQRVSLTDLAGGYLNYLSIEMYNRYNLISSRDVNHFNITFSDKSQCQSFCERINYLQKQPFEINEKMLEFVERNEINLVVNGLLMPKFLAEISLADVESLLRDYHSKDQRINQKIPFSELLRTMSKDIQRAQYEQIALELAWAYKGLTFYFPAFLDFRGRIYRCGIIHFHERDLARSLIKYKIDKPYTIKDLHGLAANQACWLSAAYHCQSFSTNDAARSWIGSKGFQYLTPTTPTTTSLEDRIVPLAANSKNKFQFLSMMLVVLNKEAGGCMPITQDASASAYQIMSYFLLDSDLAMKTNLFPSPKGGKIHDVYSHILEEFKVFLKESPYIEENLSEIVIKHLTRKIIKKIFMPIIYGKTLMSTTTYLKEEFSHYLVHKDCVKVAGLCFQFFKKKYSGLDCLITLISSIGWVMSSSKNSVVYTTPYYITIQDYLKMEPINVTLYIQNKRRRVTLRVATSKKDTRKSVTSTFVNFIHQKDAYLAMCVVRELSRIKGERVPIYTVHDNFITTPQYAGLIPKFYSTAFQNLGPPLLIIHEFLRYNIFREAYTILEKRYHESTDVKLKEKIKDQIKEMDEYSRDSGKTVFDDEFLKNVLNALVPDNASKGQRLIWEKKVELIIHSYNDYCLIVSDAVHYAHPRDKMAKHKAKWKDFQESLVAEDGYEYNCVHY